ncbi:Ryanodine receptor 1 [Balamuthia mandrillaris]
MTEPLEEDTETLLERLQRLKEEYLGHKQELGVTFVESLVDFEENAATEDTSAASNNSTNAHSSSSASWHGHHNGNSNSNNDEDSAGSGGGGPVTRGRRASARAAQQRRNAEVDTFLHIDCANLTACMQRALRELGPCHFDTIVEFIRVNWDKVKRTADSAFNGNECVKAILSVLRNDSLFTKDAEREGNWTLTPGSRSVDAKNDPSSSHPPSASLAECVIQAIRWSTANGGSTVDNITTFVLKEWTRVPTLMDKDVRSKVLMTLQSNPRFYKITNDPDCYGVSKRNRTSSFTRYRDEEVLRSNPSRAARRRGLVTPPPGFVCGCGATTPGKGPLAKWKKINEEFMCSSCAQQQQQSSNQPPTTRQRRKEQNNKQQLVEENGFFRLNYREELQRDKRKNSSSMMILASLHSPRDEDEGEEDEKDDPNTRDYEREEEPDEHKRAADDGEDAADEEGGALDDAEDEMEAAKEEEASPQQEEEEGHEEEEGEGEHEEEEEEGEEAGEEEEDSDEDEDEDGDGKDSPWICCDACQSWVLAKSDNIYDISIYDDSNPNHLDYFCPACRRKGKGNGNHPNGVDSPSSSTSSHNGNNKHNSSNNSVHGSDASDGGNSNKRRRTSNNNSNNNVIVKTEAPDASDSVPSDSTNNKRPTGRGRGRARKRALGWESEGGSGTGEDGASPLFGSKLDQMEHKLKSEYGAAEHLNPTTTKSNTKRTKGRRGGAAGATSTRRRNGSTTTDTMTEEQRQLEEQFWLDFEKYKVSLAQSRDSVWERNRQNYEKKIEQLRLEKERLDAQADADLAKQLNDYFKRKRKRLTEKTEQLLGGGRSANSSSPRTRANGTSTRSRHGGA